MCGRYRRTTAEEEIARQFNIPIPPQLDLPISYNIVPTHNILAIRRNPETGQRTLDALRWGLIPSWAKDEKIGYKTINAAQPLFCVPPGGVGENHVTTKRKPAYELR